MTTHVGIDLAWGERARTGLAALDATGRLVASTSVITDDQIADFITTHAPGDLIAAIDAPIVVPNATGRRPCEAQLQAEFGAYNAGAHPSNRSRTWLAPPRAERLAERFGWVVDPAVAPAPGISVALEVYPHPAMVTLFDLSTVIPYKNKPGRTTASRREAFQHLIAEMERVCGPTLRLTESTRWREVTTVVDTATRPMHLAAIEDEVDAIFCAYLAWLWGQHDPRMRVLGNVDEGYIVVPRPPRAVPSGARRARREPTWADVLDDAHHPGRPGHWEGLSENGWGAMLAYLAGPGLARAIPRVYAPVHVVEVDRDGMTRRYEEPITQDDIAAIDDGITTYLADHDIPAPPRGVWFELHVPDGQSVEGLESALHSATMAEVSGLDPRAERRVIARVLREHLGVGAPSLGS